MDTREFRARSEDGASAVEYALLVVAIAAVIALVVFALGSQVRDMFSTTCDNVRTQVAAGTC
jgi:pilus assembly protein Flp/PilA